MQRFYTPTQQTVSFSLGVCAVEWYCYCALCSQVVGKRLSNHMVVALSAVISCFLMTFDLDKSQLITMSIHTKMGGCVYICINTLIAVYVSLTMVAEVTASPHHLIFFLPIIQQNMLSPEYFHSSDEIIQLFSHSLYWIISI